MKIIGYVKMHRYDYLIRLQELTDQELRLYSTYVLLANWDRKNKETFGTIAKLPIRKIKEIYLKRWSIGKISNVRKSLIKKGYFRPLPEGGYAVDNYWLYQAKMYQAEQAFRCHEQGIHPSELNVQQNEQRRIEELKQDKDNLLKTLSLPPPSVQPDEQAGEGEK